MKKTLASFPVKSPLQKVSSAAATHLIRGYQVFVSPLFGPCCRFYPSCSEYTQEAIVRYGLSKGVYLGVRRLLKCHPFNPGGIDPVP